MVDERDELNGRFARYRVSPQLLDTLRASDQRSGSETVAAVPRARAIIELDADYPGGVAPAKEAALILLDEIGVDKDRVIADRSRYNVFASLALDEVERLAQAIDAARPSPVYKVWPDQPLNPLMYRSVRTIKADACFTAYGANGEGIVWAVADSGIDGTHPHFATHCTTTLPNGLEHMDFSTDSGQASSPLTDGFGHGTHVAGIIAGETRRPEAEEKAADGARQLKSDADTSTERLVPSVAAKDGRAPDLFRLSANRDERNTVRTVSERLAVGLRGVASQAKLMSLKVLDGSGNGYASNLISALEFLEGINDYGRRIKVHGVNLSLGYPFDASWFAAGHSPLCAVVNRIVRSGVVVVAAAGNDGSAFLQTEGRKGTQRIGVDQSINDPGNAEDAITVGSTHAEAPHQFGVSYFSSRGPTADGRLKPDLVAPGERILSCAASGSKALRDALGEADTDEAKGCFYYREESGTSMAAPHVSGAAAALLSIRREFIGRADEVKAILVGTCTDLKRKADYQGAGLVDLMRAIQSI